MALAASLALGAGACSLAFARDAYVGNTDSVTLTDNEGCSTSFVSTGQTAYCNGQPTASQTQAITVAYPGVKVRCPKAAKPKPCRFKLQAVTKKRKGKAESVVAKGKAKAGKAVIVSLKPKKKFQRKLASASRILVRQTLVINGAKQTGYRTLKVVR